MFGALNEEVHGAVVFRLCLILFGQGQPLHFEKPFPLQAQLLTRSDQHFDMMRFLKDLAQNIPAIEQVLHVVEDQQGFFVVQRVGELHHLIGRTREANAQHIGYSGQDGFRHAHTSQRNEMNTVCKVRFESATHFNGEACLADAAGTRQCEQAAGRFKQLFGDEVEFVFTPDERSGGDRQMRVTRLGSRNRCERGERRDRIQ